MVSHRKPAKPAFDPRTVKENIVETPLNEEMSKSFLEYAYSVIYARALPDARDGLKPVQRRIIYQMGQMSLNPDRPYMKSARVVGEVMGKLHPHGDSAIYEAMVRLAQPFAMRLPLVDGHGNFGSLDDGPAASRYTEARMAPAALGMNADIAENTGLYPRVQGTPDPNIDFRRVPNLRVFFERYAESLTTDPYEIAEWQPGDIVTFEGSHIGIISDKRNRDGIPYLIHNSGQPKREEDALLRCHRNHPISGHFRWNGGTETN